MDLLLKVKEKGKNSIGLNGGVSGLSGAFLGVNYQTNNFLGLGETLSLQGNLGNVSRQFLFGFSQPYLRNRPLNLGFQIFNNKQDFNASKNYQTTTGQSVNLSSARQQSLTQNYNQASTGLNFSLNYPLKRHAFQRIGMTYRIDKSTITAFSTASQTFFQTISFRSGIQGSNSLNGIVNSSASLTYTYNTINNPLRPRSGKEYTAAFQVAGIGGNVRYISPLVAYKRFLPIHILHLTPNGRNVLGLRAQLGYVQGFGGDVAPPNNRFYTGGEGDLRGFDVRGATPYGYVPNRVTVQLTNPDGEAAEPARCDESAAEPVPADSAAGVRHRLHRRRHQPHHQRRISYSHRRPRHDLGVRRLRHRYRAEQRPAQAEPRRLRLAYRPALWLPGVQQRRLPGRHSRIAGGLPAEHPAHQWHKLCSTHVPGQRAVSADADHQRALPALLRVQPAAAL